MFFRNLIFVLFCTAAIYANSYFGAIATGSNTGTYIKIGNDLSATFKKYKADLPVLSSKGSLENLDILVGQNKSKKASWAIVQNDALDFYRFSHFKNTREDLKEKIKVILPLYSEHIHLFSKKGNNIKFQRGGFLKVGVSSRKSGAAITAHILEKAYGIRFKYVFTGFNEAKKYLRDGILDLYIDVIALPSDKYKNITGLDLVELPKNDTLSRSYIPTSFSQKQYKWLNRSIKGYKVPSAIVTNLVKEKYNQSIEIFLKIVLKNYTQLIKQGNPKWREAYKNKTLELDNMHPIAQKLLSR